MKLSEHCFAITGLYFENPWAVNSGFVTGDKTTLVIDSGASRLSAQTIHGYAQNVQPANEIILVNTEKHFDHIGGNEFFFEKNIPIFGHGSIVRSQNDFDSMVKDMNSEILDREIRNRFEGHIPFQETRIINPTNRLQKETQIDLGSLTAFILFTPGHTDSNISIHIEEDKTLYCGDLILKDYFPNLADGDSKDWNRWILSLERISNLNLETIVPGHGKIIQGRNNIKNEIGRTSDFISKAIENN